MSLPRHVRRHLEEIGVLSPDGVTRAVRPSRCRRCGAETLVGLDGDVCAASVEADAVETDAFGEAIAVAQHRGTWALKRMHHPRKGPRWEFIPRWTWSFKRDQHSPVFVEHRCNAPPPRIAVSRFPPEKTIAQHFPDEPPF